MLIRLVFGIAAPLAVTHRLSIPLFGIRARDPLTMAGVAAILAMVQLTACLISSAPAESIRWSRCIRVIQTMLRC
jgi:hypothetical protein